MTALSDLEVNHEEEAGSLWYVRYPIAGEPDRWHVLIAAHDPHWRVRHALVRVLLRWSTTDADRLQIDEERDRIYVAARGVFAVEEYLQARYYMFRQVYFHRTLRSAEAVLRSALLRALALVERGASVWRATGTSFEKVLRRQSLSITEHLEMDDSDVIFHMKQWQHSSDPVLSDLSQRFIGRRLFKAIDLDMPQDEREDFLDAARSVVERRGFDPQYYFVEDRASDVPYYGYYTVEGVEPRTRIYIEDGYARPQIREISEVSEAVRGLGRGYELHRICFPAEVKEEVYGLYHGQLPIRSTAVSSE